MCTCASTSSNGRKWYDVHLNVSVVRQMINCHAMFFSMGRDTGERAYTSAATCAGSMLKGGRWSYRVGQSSMHHGGQEEDYIFCIFSYFFMHAPNFWGIKPLNHHFWKFCSLELMKDINRNSFMPLSTNSDAFRSPKNQSVNLMTLSATVLPSHPKPQSSLPITVQPSTGSVRRMKEMGMPASRQQNATTTSPRSGLSRCDINSKRYDDGVDGAAQFPRQEVHGE